MRYAYCPLLRRCHYHSKRFHLPGCVVGAEVQGDGSTWQAGCHNYTCMEGVVETTAILETCEGNSLLLCLTLTKRLYLNRLRNLRPISLPQAARSERRCTPTATPGSTAATTTPASPARWTSQTSFRRVSLGRRGAVALSLSLSLGLALGVSLSLSVSFLCLFVCLFVYIRLSIYFSFIIIF